MWVTDEAARVPTLVLGVISLGIDARANVLANESFLTNGPLAYGYGAFAALASFRPVRILARVDGPVQTPTDLAGKTIVFADPFSASGYLYPLKFLRDHNIVPGKLLFASSHKEAV